MVTISPFKFYLSFNRDILLILGRRKTPLLHCFEHTAFDVFILQRRGCFAHCFDIAFIVYDQFDVERLIIVFGKFSFFFDRYFQAIAKLAFVLPENFLKNPLVYRADNLNRSTAECGFAYVGIRRI